MASDVRSSRNKTIRLTTDETQQYVAKLHTPDSIVADGLFPVDSTIHANIFDIITRQLLPTGIVDLLILDPPYNMAKVFGEQSFNKMPDDDYYQWTLSWFIPLLSSLKPTATIYFCGDWRSSSVIYRILFEYSIVRNRITWEREKGRGAKYNWKNTSEDIWYATMGSEYTFNVDSVKLRRKVLAPYRENGKPKDWVTDSGGEKYRLTHPSNLWTDISVPFWSMPENTEHPTQKPEKLIAKLMLASSNEGDVVLDPFLGSGTTSVVAKKLHRSYIGIEADETYCCVAEKRLAMVEQNSSIQGYHNEIFYERNSL